MKAFSLYKSGSLRKRWLINTVGVVLILGLVCVLAVTASFAAYYYSSMEADMRNRASATTDFFADYVNQDYNDFYQSCITYVQTFEERNKMELQFINSRGELVVSSYGPWAGGSPETSEITDAMAHRDIVPFLGKDPSTGERIMAVSSPMIYTNGEVVGVLRYVSSTRLVDQQIVMVALICLLVLGMVLVVVLLSSGYYIRSILVPVAEITEEAKRISAGGTSPEQVRKQIAWAREQMEK